MRAAFVGKGGSGKTTVCALFARYLAQQHVPVMVIDADINQHLGRAVEFSANGLAAVKPLGEHLPELKTYLAGNNPRIGAGEQMVKTTPPGHGSNLLRLDALGPLDALGVTEKGIQLFTTGGFSEDDLGVKCYHSKTGAVELVLNHLIDGAGEYVLVDMTAGSDAFASGLFTRFDVTFVVVEPTRQSLDVYHQYKNYANGYGVQLAVVANQIADTDDVAYITAQTGVAPVAILPASAAVKRMERGQPLIWADLGMDAAFAGMRAMLDARVRDWAAYQQQMNDFHTRNAHSWANAAMGFDLRTQIDPNYNLDDSI